MPNNKEQGVEANVRESERENERSEESKESEEMREMRAEIEVLKRALVEQKLRAQRDALAACLLYTSPSPRDKRQSRMPSSA